MNGGFDDERRPAARIAGRHRRWRSRRWSSAPLIAGALTTGTPAALLSLPAESIAVVLILLAAARAAGSAGSSRAPSASSSSSRPLVAALDLGFEATIDRAFSLAEDWPGDRQRVRRRRRCDRHGQRDPARRRCIVALLVGAVHRRSPARRCAPSASRRARGAPAGSRPRRSTTTWILCALVGAQLLPGRAVRGRRRDGRARRDLGADRR